MVVRSVSRWSARLALASTLTLLAVTALLWGHGEVADSQRPYSGRGWTSGSGGGGGIAGGGPGIQFPSDGIELLAWIPATQFNPGNTTTATVEGYVSPSGREYAVVGISDGTGFVDVTDPGSPVILGFIPGPDSLWKDVRMYQEYAYSVSEGGSGIQVMDMAVDNGVVTLVGSFNTPEGTTPATHTVFINPDSGYLYRCGGGSNGLRIYSLADPANPTYVSSWTTNYVHECLVVNYTEGPYAGKEICFVFNGGGDAMQILDVTNKLNIVQLSISSYAGAAYCHQGWLSPDRQFMYINDETDNALPTLTRVFDVSVLESPKFVGTFGNGGICVDHNLYTLGNLIFESNYRSGLRIFDATNKAAPIEVAYFDTYPSDDNQGFNGLWDNYPYLPSGIVLGSDIEKGLFIWNIGPNLLTFDWPAGNPALIDPTGETLPVTIAGKGGQLEPASAKLHVNFGSGWVQSDLAFGGGDQFTAQFPAVPCGAQVQYYISAQTTSGTTVRDPVGAPVNTYSATAATGESVGLEDTMELNTGWVAGAPGDSAVTGLWTRVDPNGTGTQPENDHTPDPGTVCWVTGQGPVGGGLGDQDVDGGITTLVSRTLDATGGDLPYIEYHRWYSNNQGGDPGNDSMPVDISNDNGASWTPLELVTENAGTWVNKSFRIDDFVAPTATIKLRFIARDLLGGSVVEAGVDDLRIVYYDCTPITPGDTNGDGNVNVDDLLIVIGAWGNCPAPPADCVADVNGDNVVNVDDLLMVISNWG